jgi:hypothetical protein
VVAEIDGLRALEMGVSRGRPVAVRLRLRRQGLHQGFEQGDCPGGMRPHKERQVRRHLVVSRPRGAELAAERPDQLGEAPLDRHVDVLVVLAELEAPLIELATDPVEPLADLRELILVEDAEPRQRACVCLGLLDVERTQPPVEGDR